VGETSFEGFLHDNDILTQSDEEVASEFQSIYQSLLEGHIYLPLLLTKPSHGSIQYGIEVIEVKYRQEATVEEQRDEIFLLEGKRFR
jgi:hypothetical protein